MKPIAWNTVERVLAVRLGGVGDVVETEPALRALRTSLPNAELSLMCLPESSQVAPLLPWIDDIVECHVGDSERWPDETSHVRWTVASVRKRHVDVAIVFTGARQSPYVPGYICYLSGVPVRLGQSREFGGGVLSHCATPPDDVDIVTRHLMLLEAAGLSGAGDRVELQIPPVIQMCTDQRLRGLGLAPGTRFVLLAPDAEYARDYDWQRIIQTLTAIVGIPLVVLDGEHVFARDRFRNARANRVINVIGRTSVSELAALVRRASIVVTDSPDVIPIARAFDRPIRSVPTAADDVHIPVRWLRVDRSATAESGRDRKAG